MGVDHGDDAVAGSNQVLVFEHGVSLFHAAAGHIDHGLCRLFVFLLRA